MNSEVKELSKRDTKVAKILISQPEPTLKNSPYHKLAEKFGIEVHFRPFIHVEGVDSKEFRKQKINILDHTAVIFTSRNAVDNFFRICQDLKVEVPVDMKYFCVSEQTANYLQKYITIRKRKLFVGQKTARDLFDLFKKHKNEKYLYPCSNIRKEEIPNFFAETGLSFTETVMYCTVASDLSDLSSVNYDIIAFFSPSGVKSLYTNFPDFEQKNTRIAAFGPTTAKEVKDSDLILDIEAPLPNAPSMTGALELYIKAVNGKK